ncbi:hypothetical protein, partial [Streptomyces telluris]|uniref:hypothetical protein n=1 Tax=Streptomyces telluris TaxID=2720021 RepID=UPI0019D16BB4
PRITDNGLACLALSYRPMRSSGRPSGKRALPEHALDEWRFGDRSEARDAVRHLEGLQAPDGSFRTGRVVAVADLAVRR